MIWAAFPAVESKSFLVSQGNELLLRSATVCPSRTNGSLVMCTLMEKLLHPEMINMVNKFTSLVLT